ncbi:MAG: metallophosphoesterase [Clostridiales bacterium]|nr:metallophosphoesterase [Clostridiales bacterium]
MKKVILFLTLLFCFMPAHAALSESESILALSDTHLSGDPLMHAVMMDAVIRAAQGRDLVLMTGDNTDNAHPEEHALVLQWAREIERRTGAEVYILPGNHDYGAYFGRDQFIALYGAYGRDRAFSLDPATAGYAVMTPKGTCLLMLDTNQPDTDRSFLPDGRIEDRTQEWVRQVLDSLPDGTPVIVCGHHPILPEERDARTPGAATLSRVLRTFGAGVYLCGHDHGFATVEQDGLRQITLGQPQAYPGWCGVLERDGDNFHWHTELIYAEDSPDFLRLRESAFNMSRNMALGTLESTPFAGDEEAVGWFSAVFMLASEGRLTPEERSRLLTNSGYRKWQQVETRTVVKAWILGLLENPPEDLRQLALPPSRKLPQ